MQSMIRTHPLPKMDDIIKTSESLNGTEKYIFCWWIYDNYTGLKSLASLKMELISD
jgi:hypothetical protein